MAARKAKRHGRDARTAGRVSATGWTSADTARRDYLAAKAKIAEPEMRKIYAELASQLEVQARGLLGLAVRNADEENALVQVQKARLAALLRLRLDEEADDEEEEENDDG